MPSSARRRSSPSLRPLRPLATSMRRPASRSSASTVCSSGAWKLPLKPATTSPIELPVSARARRNGWKSSACAARSMRRRVSGATEPWPESARDAVPSPTPASAARSLIVAIARCLRHFCAVPAVGLPGVDRSERGK